MDTVLITGSSSGVGYAAALSFARKGFQVIATMRNFDKITALKKIADQEKLPIDFRELDVTNEASVQSVVNSILHDYKKIDILINNAGAGFLGTLEQTTLSQAQKIMDVNFFGVWRLTQAVLPSMRKKKSGRIISLSSVGGIIGQPFNEAYCAAKFAVEGLMESLAPIAKRFGVQITLVEPGPIDTDFVSSTLERSPELHADLENDYKVMLDSYYQIIKTMFKQIAQTPDEIATLLLEIATTDQAHLRYQTSEAGTTQATLKLSDTTGNQIVAMTGSRLP